MNIRRAGRVAVFIAAAYVCDYAVVRVTHLKYWFDKAAGKTGSCLAWTPFQVQYQAA